MILDSQNTCYLTTEVPCVSPSVISIWGAVGWRDVLALVLHDDKQVSFWPFDGRLNDLLLPGRIIIVETYPTECYTWFFPEPVKGKGNLEVRKNVGDDLLNWAKSTCVKLESVLAQTIREGFPEGDDPFDAVVGLFGMYAFILGQRRAGAKGSGTAGTGARGSDSSGGGITPPIPETRCLAGASRLPRRLPS
jgi:hypothetical protein